ncbi:MAG: 5'/3'-nucleotidase SurE [Chloroflexi bacterium]|nr:5'/3'-nucleotidase SurE [Chloroflexota bacterium]
MDILVTNDDGIHSPGLAALAAALRPLGDVVVLAPDSDRSGLARAIYHRRSLSLEPAALSDGSAGYQTDGTPTDCTRLAFLGALGAPPRLVVSGINPGYNLGRHVTYSGTMGPVFDAAGRGATGLGVSTANGGDPDLGAVAALAARIAGRLLRLALPPGLLFNLNVPGNYRGDPAHPIRFTRLGQEPRRERLEIAERPNGARSVTIVIPFIPADSLPDTAGGAYGGDPAEVSYAPGTDLAAVHEGAVSLTPLVDVGTAPAALSFNDEIDLEAALLPAPTAPAPWEMPAP